MSKLLTVKETEAVLRLGHTKVCELISKGEIETLLIGRSRRVPEDAVNRFIQRKMKETAGETCT